MRKSVCLAIVLALFAEAGEIGARAAEEPAAPAAEIVEAPGAAVADRSIAGSTWKLSWNPTTDLYPRYLANPWSARNQASYLNAFDAENPDDSGANRVVISLGGQYGLLRWDRLVEPGYALQINFEGGIYTQWDIDHGLDELGHDGRFGANLAWSLRDDLALKFQYVHRSSHVGDEYIFRNPGITQRPLKWRKDELALGASWSFADRWRAYGEFGYGWHLGPTNEPLRFELGIEYKGKPRWKNRAHWYTAFDLVGEEESDFHASTTLQTGVMVPFPDIGRTYRIGLEAYQGRALLNELSNFDEKHLSVGIWLDL